MTTVTSLTAGSALQGPELLYAAQSSADRKITATQIKDFAATTTVNAAQFRTGSEGANNDHIWIQAAIDYALNNGLTKVFIPEGMYTTSDTIHLGYGWGGTSGRYSNVSLVGASGFSPGAFGSLAHTRITANFVDRPIINMQGQQNAGIENLYLLGSVNIAGGNPTGFTIEQYADIASYIPAGAATDRRAPFCAVCIDGYYGATFVGTTPYPTPTYPAWITSVGAASPYNRYQSTNCWVRNCRFNSTHIGIMLQPNSDGNGDFMDFSRNEYLNLRIGVAIGNTQARSTVYDHSKFGGVHTCINSYDFGGFGNLSGSLNNLHADYCFQLFKANGSWAKGIQISNFYSEVMTRIGEMYGSPSAISFLDCYFTVNNNNGGSDRLMLPALHIDSSASSQVKFVGCKFVEYYGLLHIKARATFENCTWQARSAPSAGVEATAMLRLAQTTTDVSTSNVPLGGPIHSNCNIDGATYTGVDTPGFKCWHSFAIGSGSAEAILPYVKGRAAVQLSSVTWSGRTLSGTAAANFIAVGDVIFDQTLGWLVVTSVAGSTIGATMMTGYKTISGTTTMLTVDNTGLVTARNDAYMNSNYSSVGGEYYPVNIFDHTLSANNRFWKTTSGSATVSYVDSSGSAQTLPAGITTSSKLFWIGDCLNASPAFPFGQRPTVSSVGSTSVDMSTTANVTGWFASAPGLARIA